MGPGLRLRLLWREGGQQVGAQVGDVFQADGDAQETWGDAEARQLFIRERAAPGGGWIHDQRLDIAQRSDPTQQPYLGFELSAEIQPIVKLVTATARLSPFANASKR